MATPVELPKLGNTVEECILLRGEISADLIGASDLGPPPVKITTIRERIARRMRYLIFRHSRNGSTVVGNAG